MPNHPMPTDPLTRLKRAARALALPLLAGAVLWPLHARAAADLSTTEATAPNALADCYRLAGEPYAPPAFQGVMVELIDADAAIKACEAARGLDPKDAMLADLIGRAYQARGDFPTARRFFTEASEAGNAYGKANLSLFLIEGAGGPAEPQKGLALLQEVAEAGNMLAQYSLGLVYREGRAGQVPAPGKAVDWLARAAGQGHAVAMYDLAMMLRDGEGVPADPMAALSWLEKAASLGDIDSQAALGYSFEQGLGTPVDYAAAREWYGRAAEKNQIDAMTNLGRLFEAGEGGPVDYERAFQLYRDAAEAGSPVAMANLANFYEFGTGTDQSHRDAAYWLARAIMAGNDDVIEQLAQSPDQFSLDVRQGLQTFVTSRGLYAGPIDGAMTEGTLTALRRLVGETP